MRFSGTLGPHTVELNGTVEEIFSQMASLHPGFDPDILVSSRKPLLFVLI